MRRFILCLFALLIVGVPPALSARFGGGKNFAIQTINVPGLTLGAVTVNSLAPAYFSNEADTVFQNTEATTTPTKYIGGPDADHFLLKTLNQYRDVEVSGYAIDGITFLRFDGSKAIFFWHNGNTTTGDLEVGIMTGINEAGYAAFPPGPNASFRIYQNTDLVGTIGASGTTCTCGYTKPGSGDTSGQYWTFGVSGFDIYIKYNGVEFARFKDYRQMNAGTVAFKANNGYGWRGNGSGNLTVTPLPTQQIYSRYSLNELDMRDFGMRSIQTTGTISASSTSLVIAAKQNFQVGDWVIVEIGAEAGAGARGTVGVGGQWPALSYANITAMNADNTQPQYTYAYLLDTGNVYQYGGGFPAWNGGVTYNIGDSVSYSGTNYQTLIDHNIGNQPDTSPTAWRSSGSATGSWVPADQLLNYYTAKAVPLSLHGRIVAISGDGLTLTLDTSATTTTTNANVYLDNQPYINYLIGGQQFGGYADLVPVTPSDTTIILPTGSYAGSGRLYVQAQANWTIKGHGQTSTTLFSPKGVQPLNFQVGYIYNGVRNNGYVLSDFTISGNQGLTKFGLDFPGFTYIPGGLLPNGLMPPNHGDFSTITQTDVPQGSAFPPAILYTTSDNGTVQDITVNDVFQKAVGVNFSTNVNAYRVTNRQHDALQHYIQWQFQWANSFGGSCVDCVLNSDYLIAGFESFQSTGHHFIRPISTNGTFSQNTSNDWLIQDAQLTITANSQYSPTSFSEYQVVVNVNSNIGGYDVSLGGTVSNFVAVAQGYIDANKDDLIGVNINSGNPNVTVTGGSYTAPAYASPSALQGPVGVNSTGLTTVVNGFTVCGATGSLYKNINLVGAGSSVTGSTADSITAPTTSGNTIPCP